MWLLQSQRLSRENEYINIFFLFRKKKKQFCVHLHKNDDGGFYVGISFYSHFWFMVFFLLFGFIWSNMKWTNDVNKPLFKKIKKCNALPHGWWKLASELLLSFGIFLLFFLSLSLSHFSFSFTLGSWLLLYTQYTLFKLKHIAICLLCVGQQNQDEVEKMLQQQTIQYTISTFLHLTAYVCQFVGVSNTILLFMNSFYSYKYYILYRYSFGIVWSILIWYTI